MITADETTGRTVERVVLAMVGARIALASREILYAFALGDSTICCWFTLFTVLAVAYVITAWRYPRADRRWRSALLLLAFADLGLTGYEVHRVWGGVSDFNGHAYYLASMAALLILFVPGLVIAALVGRDLSKTSHSDPVGGASSFVSADGTVVELAVDEDY